VALVCGAKMGLRQFFIAVISLSQFLSIAAEETKSSQSCDFPAIFNFGDSNSDTGCMSAAFYPAALPYGETFFHEAAGRASDGRLIIDFIGTHFSFTLFFFMRPVEITLALFMVSFHIAIFFNCWQYCVNVKKENIYYIVDLQNK